MPHKGRKLLPRARQGVEVWPGFYLPFGHSQVMFIPPLRSPTHFRRGATKWHFTPAPLSDRRSKPRASGSSRSPVSTRREFALVSSDFPYSTSILQKIRRARQLQSRFREWLLDTILQQVEDIRRIMTDWHPDVLVCDSAFWSPILVLRETEPIDVAVLSVTAACILPGPDSPAWGQGLRRPRNGLMRMRSACERTLIDSACVFRAEVNALRRRYGLLALDCSVTRFAGRMPLYLVPSTREYDYDRRDLPPSVHYVGPCLWDKPSSTPPAEWLLRLPADKPLIYVTKATIGKSGPFLLRQRLFHSKPAGRLCHANDNGKQRNPAKICLVSLHQPSGGVLCAAKRSPARTSVMVTLGGSGGVLAALRAGVPLVVVPNDGTAGNARRVVEAGAGLRIAPDRCTPERLRAAVNRVLSEPSFRENA